MNNAFIFAIQFGLGIMLFFITNWIGKHSYSIGYMEISMFVKSETAPAFNFLFRVLSPVVYIIIISAILYQFGLDELVQNIYLVPVYYIAFRLFFNVVTNRARLLNWRRQAIHVAAIVTTSWLAYDSIIREKKNILPDFGTISNELWVIILLFLFQILNKLQFSSGETERRKENFLRQRYFKFKRDFDDIIAALTMNKKIQALAYAILIYEDFNRPKIARIAESIKFRVTKKPMTLGVMQIKSTELINDAESVKRGVQKILNDLKTIQDDPELQKGACRDYQLLTRMIEKFNGGTSYKEEVTELFGTIWRKFYDGDNLFEKYTFETEQ